MEESARIKDYINHLEMLFIVHKGEPFIDVNSGELHKTLSLKPTLPTCCMAMKQRMREGDAILSAPKTRTGFGVHLQIRYYLDNRESKKLSYPLKKRGRHRGLCIKHNKAKKDRHIDTILMHWLEDNGYSYEIKQNMFIITIESSHWYILWNLPERGKNKTFYHLVYDLFSIIQNPNNKYSIYIQSNKWAEKLWDNIAKELKEQYHLSLLLCTQREHIIEV